MRYLRLFLLIAVLLPLAWSCKKNCDAFVHKPNRGAYCSQWRPVMLQDSLLFINQSGLVKRLNRAQLLEGAYYPEAEIPCKDLYLTHYDRYIYKADSTQLELSLETNEQSGERMRVKLFGTEMISPLAVKQGQSEIIQADTVLLNVVYNELDSMQIGGYWYKPVRIMEVLSNTRIFQRVYASQQWGILRYELINGDSWELKR